MYALRRQMKTDEIPLHVAASSWMVRVIARCALWVNLEQGRSAGWRLQPRRGRSARQSAPTLATPVAHVCFDGCASHKRNERTATATGTLDHLISATKRSWADQAQRLSRSLDRCPGLIFRRLKQSWHAGGPSLRCHRRGVRSFVAHGYTLGIITSCFQCDLGLMARRGLTYPVPSHETRRGAHGKA